MPITMTDIELEAKARRIDADRRAVELMALLALTPVVRNGQRHAIHAVRLGVDPVRAVRDVYFGNSEIGQPGLVPTFAELATKASIIGHLRTYSEARENEDSPNDLRGLRAWVLDHDYPMVPNIEIDQARENDDHKHRDVWLMLLALLGLSATEFAGTQKAALAQARLRVEKMIPGLADRLERQAKMRRAATVGTPEISGPASLRPLIDDAKEAFRASGMGIENPWLANAWVESIAVKEYEKGRFDGFRKPRVYETLWGFHRCAVLDTRTSRICRAFDGVVAPKDDSFWQTWQLPLHWHCRSVNIPVWKSTALNEPSTIEPDVTNDDIIEFLKFVAKFRSYL